MKRRDFLKLSATGVATIVMGSHLPFLGAKNAFGATQTLDITITDALKDMITHNAINNAQCYHWVYKMKADGVDIPVECPGPSIYAIKGDSITVNITNALDEPHAFFIPGSLPTDPVMFDSGPIPPNGTFTGTFTATQSGAHLYYDNLNAPVNRVMGLHGALVVRPAAAAVGHNFTPYDNPTPHVQNMFDDLGNPNVWPGLKWEGSDPTTNTPPSARMSGCTTRPAPTCSPKWATCRPGRSIRPSSSWTGSPATRSARPGTTACPSISPSTASPASCPISARPSPPCRESASRR